MRHMDMKQVFLPLLVALTLTGCGAEATGVQQAVESPAGSSCLGGETDMQPTDKYVGMTETEALQRAQVESGGRVIARDGECLGRSRDVRDRRVNLVVMDGRVVSAAVERLPR